MGRSRGSPVFVHAGAACMGYARAQQALINLKVLSSLDQQPNYLQEISKIINVNYTIDVIMIALPTNFFLKSHHLLTKFERNL